MGIAMEAGGREDEGGRKGNRSSAREENFASLRATWTGKDNAVPGHC